MQAGNKFFSVIVRLVRFYLTAGNEVEMVRLLTLKKHELLLPVHTSQSFVRQRMKIGQLFSFVEEVGDVGNIVLEICFNEIIFLEPQLDHFQKLQSVEGLRDVVI